MCPQATVTPPGDPTDNMGEETESQETPLLVLKKLA